MWDPSWSNRVGLVEEFLEPQAKEKEQTPQGFTHTSSPNLPEPQEIEKYIYGHHVDQASFLLSMNEGCAMCNRFSPLKEDSETNGKPEKLGYFSVFYVLLSGGKLIMFVHYGNSQGGFDFVPVGGKLHFGASGSILQSSIRD